MMITMKRNPTFQQAWQEFDHAFWQLAKVLRRNVCRYCDTFSRGYVAKNHCYFADRTDHESRQRHPDRHDPSAKR